MAKLYSFAKLFLPTTLNWEPLTFANIPAMRYVFKICKFMLSCFVLLGEPEQTPLLHGEWCGGHCANDRGKNGIATHCCSFGRVVHLQANMINLWLLHSNAKIFDFIY